MLANKFDPDSQFAAPVEFEGAIFLDRDPDSFKYVLNYLRDGCRARFGAKGVDVKQLEADADYFGLVGLKTFCVKAQKAAEREGRDTTSSLRKIATSSKQLANKIEALTEKIEGIADGFNTESICDKIEALTENIEGIANGAEDICNAITDNSNTEAICGAITDNRNTEAICDAIRSADSKIELIADAMTSRNTTIEINETVHGNIAEVLKDGLEEVKDSIRKVKDSIREPDHTTDICDAIGNAGSKIEDLVDVLKGDGLHGNLVEVLKDGLEEVKDKITDHTDTAELMFHSKNQMDSNQMFYGVENIKQSINLMTDTVGHGLSIVAQNVESAKMSAYRDEISAYRDEPENRSFRRERSWDSNRSSQRRRRSVD